MTRYMINKGCSVLMPDGTQLVGPCEIPAKCGLTEKFIQTELVANRYAYPIGSKVAEERLYDKTPPGVDEPPVLAAAESDKITLLSPSGVSTTSRPVTSVSQPPTPWTLDPTSLNGKTLEQLNVMIQERDDKVEPFQTVEEASAWLSQDFTAKK